MTGAVDLHRAVLALLAGLPTVTAFDANVPDAPPADRVTGAVYPYAVLWPSPGGRGPEASVANTVGTDWTATVTVAAGDVGWVLAAVAVVRAALDDALIAPGTRLQDETPAARTIQRDPDVSPPRWFVPLMWRAITP